MQKCLKFESNFLGNNDFIRFIVTVLEIFHSDNYTDIRSFTLHLADLNQ